MEFVVNVLPNDTFTMENVKQFVLNIESQHSANVVLVFKQVPSLTPALVNYIKNTNVESLIVKRYSDIQLDPTQQTYWINLHVTDCLLPNAVIQWEQVIQRHTSDVVELNYLQNELPLIKQTEDLIDQINQKHPVRLNTVKAVLHLPLNVPLFNLSLSSQLLILFGLQNYKVMDTLKRYLDINSSYLGVNFLIRCTPALLNSFDSGLVKALVKTIINSPEIVRINLPTIILNQFSLKSRLNWLAEVSASANYIGDAKLLSQYQKFVDGQVTQTKKDIFHSKISRFTKHHLMSKVRQISKTLLQTK